MSDIVVGIGFSFVLSLVALQLGRAAGRGKRPSAWAAVFASLTFIYAGFIHGNIVLAEWFPISNIIVVSNCFPVLAACLAGLVGADCRAPGLRRHSLAAVILVAGWFSIVWNTTTQELDSTDCYLNGVCLQSTPATCSACSTATLLSLYGIKSSEAEMTRLCLTSGRGTQLLGIYRGLVLKTEGTPYRVEIVRSDFDKLVGSQLPIVAPVKRVDFSDSAQMASFAGFNWVLELLGTSEHCVTITKLLPENKVEVADPASVHVNPKKTEAETVARSWTGVGYRLVKR